MVIGTEFTGVLMRIRLRDTREEDLDFVLRVESDRENRPTSCNGVENDIEKL